MPFYKINFTDPTKNSFDIMRKKLDGPGALTTNTPLHLYGRGALEWGEYIDENLLRLLECSAGATQPPVAVPGQLWKTQLLYWRNTTKSIQYDPNDPDKLNDEAIFLFDVNTGLWNAIEMFVTNDIDATYKAPGSYVFDVTTQKLHLFYALFPGMDTVGHIREYARKLRDPNVADFPRDELLTYDLDGKWRTVGFRNTHDSLNIHLDTLGTHDDVGMYFQDNGVDAKVSLGYPFDSLSGSLMILPAPNNTVTQIYRTRSERTLHRTNVEGFWTDWLESSMFDDLLGKPSHYTPSPHGHDYYRDVTTRPNNTGMITAWPVTSVPAHVIVCDGRAVSRTTYAELFAKIGTTYGAGNGSTTFNVPDYRDQFLRGVTTGRAVGNAQAGMTQSHSHSGSIGSAGSHTHGSANVTTSSAGNHTHGAGSLWADSALSGSSGSIPYNGWVFSAEYGVGSWQGGKQPPGGDALYIGGSVASAGSHTHTVSIPSAGSHSHSISIGSYGGAETRPKNIAVVFAIVAYS